MIPGLKCCLLFLVPVRFGMFISRDSQGEIKIKGIKSYEDEGVQLDFCLPGSFFQVC